MSPLSFNLIEFAAGTLGSPGIVMIAPHMTTINSAPLESRTSLIGIVWFEGAPFKVGSVEKLYCVLAIQIGKSPYPSFSNCFNWSIILLSATTSSASYISLAIVFILSIRGDLLAQKYYGRRCILWWWIFRTKYKLCQMG